MTMEVKKVKYKNTKLYKTQTEVTYSERGKTNLCRHLLQLPRSYIVYCKNRT